MLDERIFYSCEDIICNFDRLSYHCSIKTFDYGIILFPQLVVRVYNPLGVKRFQIAQFKGYFYTTRRDSVWQLFAYSINISSVELVWNESFCCLIYAHIYRLKLIDKIVSNDNHFTVILCLGRHKFTRDNQRTLSFRAVKFLRFGWQIRKDDDIENIFVLF